jgi:hypothetical protein
MTLSTMTLIIIHSVNTKYTLRVYRINTQYAQNIHLV